MPKQLGNHAIVIGAGIGGLLFARVLSESFETVTVVERDLLADSPQPRNGLPQGKHFHGLLAGGCRAMDALLPALTEDFEATGAVRLVASSSTRVEMPGYEPFPQRDLGFWSYGMSRPLLELCVRGRVQAIPNIRWEQSAIVDRLTHENGTVTGVALRDGRTLSADFVIDASGRGEVTLKTFDEMHIPRPAETTIGVDLHYATALFEIPAGAAYDWQVLVTHPELPPAPARGAMMSVIEGNRWICGIAWRGENEVPADRESFVEWTRTNLRTQTLYRAIEDARMVSKIAHYFFDESRHRHFSALESLPANLLPVADAVCRFNPVHGQGMSVAALEAEALHQLLANWEGDDLRDLARTFLMRSDQIIAAPWNMAALPDLAYPDARGQRPPDLMQSLMFGAALTELAARDAQVHKVMMEVRSLLKPYSAMTSDPTLMQRAQGIMAEMAQRAAAQAERSEPAA